MSTKDDGGPAFPLPLTSDGLGGIEYTDSRGLTVRDWFAGQALAGVMANPDTAATARAMEARGDADGSQARQLFAEVVWLMADAMLAERTKP